MKRAILILSFLAALIMSSQPRAQCMLLLGVEAGCAAGSAPSCSNEMDFSSGCNSQYVPLIGGFP